MSVRAERQGDGISDPADAESALARYEAMSSEEVNEELRAAGIDASPTIARVAALVREMSRPRPKAPAATYNESVRQVAALSR